MIPVMATLNVVCSRSRPRSVAIDTVPTNHAPNGPTMTPAASRMMLLNEKPMREPTSGSRSR